MKLSKPFKYPSQRKIWDLNYYVIPWQIIMRKRKALFYARLDLKTIKNLWNDYYG